MVMLWCHHFLLTDHDHCMFSGQGDIIILCSLIMILLWCHYSLLSDHDHCVFSGQGGIVILCLLIMVMLWCHHSLLTDLHHYIFSGHDGLQWRDVFILCMSHYFTINDGILRSLRNRGVPVRLLNPDDPEDAVRDVALALSNQVTVTDYESASSLERRVVIGLGEGVGFYRLLAMSRCTAQLVWVDEPVRL